MKKHSAAIAMFERLTSGPGAGGAGLGLAANTAASGRSPRTKARMTTEAALVIVQDDAAKRAVKTAQLRAMRLQRDTAGPETPRQDSDKAGLPLGSAEPAFRT